MSIKVYASTGRNGARFSVFSTETKTYMLKDLTKDQLTGWFVRQKVCAARVQATKEINSLMDAAVDQLHNKEGQ